MPATHRRRAPVTAEPAAPTGPPVTAAAHAASAYTARHLSVLEGLEAVRKRPGMYIGSTDSRGIPVDVEPKTKLTGVELVMTRLHAGGKFGGGSYTALGGLHGVGASVVNA